MYIPFSFSGGSSFIAPVTASGGLTGSFISGGIQWQYHDFLPSSSAAISGSFTVTSGYTNNAKLLIVGGGGAGGGVDNNQDGTVIGAGGGGGGVIYFNNFTLEPGTYTVYVGAGGVGGIYNPFGNDRFPTNGQNSSIVFGRYALVGIGGGVGSTEELVGNGGDGGSGGGRSAQTGTFGIGLQPTSEWGGFGNNGGNVDWSQTGANLNSGGGGGAGGVGGNAVVGGSAANRRGGDGGLALGFNLTGTLTYFGGGGGGLGFNPGFPNPTFNNATRSGGRGYKRSSTAALSENGINGKGGGGGGGANSSGPGEGVFNGSFGGSGRVIFAYPISGSL